VAVNGAASLVSTPQLSPNSSPEARFSSQCIWA
jgi:hypothetical protein